MKNCSWYQVKCYICIEKQREQQENKQQQKKRKGQKMKNTNNIDSFFSFKVQKQNLNEFDQAALRCGMNPDELTEVIKDGPKNWHSYLKNGKEVATWITYNGRLCFAGVMKAKNFKN